MVMSPRMTTAARAAIVACMSSARALAIVSLTVFGGCAGGGTFDTHGASRSGKHASASALDGGADGSGFGNSSDDTMPAVTVPLDAGWTTPHTPKAVILSTMRIEPTDATLDVQSGSLGM